MQGWRSSQEDAIISLQELDFKGTKGAMFGVYDGHGGPEVSMFVKNNLQTTFKKSKFFQQKKYDKALQESHFVLDQMMQTE